MGPLEFPRASISGVLADHPLSAEYALSGPGAKQVRSWVTAIYRATDGSLRTEMSIEGAKWVSIVDVARQRLVILQVNERVAVVSKYQSSGSANSLWGYNSRPNYTEDRRDIMGNHARRIRLANNENPEVSEGEVWIVEEYGLAVEDIRYSGDRKVIWRITSFSRNPPPAALFEIPSDYAQQR